VIAQTRAEILKIRSTRTTLGLVLTLVGLVLLFVLLTGLLTESVSLDEEQNQRDLLSLGSLSAVFAALAGVLLVTSEYRFGTIRPTFLVTPRRSRVVGAKLAAGMVAGLVFGVIGEALGFGIGRIILSARDIPTALDGGDVTQLLLGTPAATACWGGIGVGLATILRNQIASVIGLLAWVFVVDGLLFALVPSVGRLLPSAATDALIGQTREHLVPAAAGGALLVAWVAGLTLVGVVLTARRDVG
jgi:ABC-type transport system involved in multi-copper enzyme maturation permease subunit